MKQGKMVKKVDGECFTLQLGSVFRELLLSTEVIFWKIGFKTALMI